MERIGSTGSFRSLESSNYLSSKFVKSHGDLHHAVFPNGGVESPSGTLKTRYPELDSTDKSFSDELLARRRVSNLRPSSARLTPPSTPSPKRQLPRPPPSHGTRLSSAFESIPTLDFGDDIPSPVQHSPRRRAAASQFPQDVEPRWSPGLSRPASLIQISSLEPELNDKLSRTNSLTNPTKPVPRRRDSIVSQRVKAYNSSQDGIDGVQLSMETLSKFPTPPMPPVPRAPVPKPLDHSKYTFT